MVKISFIYNRHIFKINKDISRDLTWINCLNKDIYNFTFSNGCTLRSKAKLRTSFYDCLTLDEIYQVLQRIGLETIVKEYIIDTLKTYIEAHRDKVIMSEQMSYLKSLTTKKWETLNIEISSILEEK
jgi:hypothetical protein